MSCIEWLAHRWRVVDELPAKADLIALVSFGAAGNDLTKGSKAALVEALGLVWRYPTARVAFGAFTLSPVAGVEEGVKRTMFQNPIFAGSVVNTIEEAEKIRDAMPPGFAPRTIVFVTDEWHSRSAKRVWEQAWRENIPRPEIFIATVPSAEVISAENPMKALRSHFWWALANVLRHAFLVFVPGSVWFMKKLNVHQPT